MVFKTDIIRFAKCPIIAYLYLLSHLFLKKKKEIWAKNARQNLYTSSPCQVLLLLLVV